MIRIARERDLQAIMEIITETISDLKKEGNNQWSETYPRIEHFERDLINECLYVYTIRDEVAGVIALNKEESLEYRHANWQSPNQAIIIHRFAIKSKYQRRKIGTTLVKFAEQVAEEKNLFYIKVDTNSKNIRMNALFNHLGYHFCGQIYMGGLTNPFNCYDKQVISN